jgi:hypothetical protein
MATKYDPHPPLGDIDYERLPFVMKLMRGFMSLQAPIHTRKPKQLMRQGL